MTATEVYYDPYDYSIDADPYPVWKRLRDEAPLYHNERLGFYALSRYDDVLAGLLDSETFVSSHGITLEMIGDEPIGIPMMIMMDPPTHTRLRKLVNRAFTPKAIDRLTDRIHAICADLLDPLVGAGPFDFTKQYAGLIPPTVILALVGFPDGFAEEFREEVDSTMHLDADVDPTRLGPPKRVLVDTAGEIDSVVFSMLPDLIKARRAQPEDDLISALVHSEIDDDEGHGRTLTVDEIVGFVQLISLAGSETVVRLLGFSAVELARNPDQLQILVDEPGVIPNAVEETLRYDAPSPIQGRWVARDVEVHGTVIPRGSKLALLNASADRDERHFPDPDRFLVRRDIDRHLAFGYGTHFCIGAALARLEGRIGLEELIRRFPRWEVDEDNLQRIHTSTVRGYTSVPLTPLG
ncbi:MAG: cytochrome P450 [Actinobacteria bacterium]|nr:cytochrome P450 [Actinomycetota bacterium]